MRKAIILLITLLFTSGILAQEYSNPTIEQIATCGLPIFVITTIDEEEPTCDIVKAPEGEEGTSITNTTKVPGRLKVIKDGIEIYDSGDYQENVSGMRIRIRGNSSAIWEKKPYKINLQKKADLLFRGDDRLKDKEWIMLANYELANPVGFKMNEIMRMQWAPGYEMVNLFINGNYRGIYTLTESEKRNSDARLNVDKNTGYIFECDPYWWNEDVYFKSDSGRAFTFKYPSDKDITDGQIDYLKEYINKVEASIEDGTYGEYIDVESFASWLLGMDVLGIIDAAGTNIFMTKYDNTENTKIRMGNYWDFGAVATVGTDRWSNVHLRYFYFQDLFASTNAEFNIAYNQLWKHNRTRIETELLSFISNYPSTDMAQGVDASIPYEMERWQYFDEEPTLMQANTLYTYLESRLEWLDENIPILTEGIVNTQILRDEATYNMLGQKILPETARKGIFIINGKKVIRR